MKSGNSVLGSVTESNRMIPTNNRSKCGGCRGVTSGATIAK